MDKELRRIRSSIYQASRINRNITFKNAQKNQRALCDAITHSLELTIKFISTRLSPRGYYTLTYMDDLKTYSADIYNVNISIKTTNNILRNLNRIMRKLKDHITLSDSDSDSDPDSDSNYKSYSEPDDSNDADFVASDSQSEDSDMNTS